VVADSWRSYLSGDGSKACFVSRYRPGVPGWAAV
jgi:hypothetical protein